jgi:hypothetical protein
VNLLISALLFASCARAETANIRAVQKNNEVVLIQRSTEPVESAEPALPDLSGKTAAELGADYISAVSNEEKIRLLDALQHATPKTERDLHILVALFLRDDASRDAAQRCLHRLPADAQEFGPYFLALINDEDSFLRIFGMNGALRLRYEPALKPIDKFTQERFPARRRTTQMLPKQANLWQLQFAALSTLTAWKGCEVLPLLLRKSQESPDVAGLAAAYCWPEAFDKFASWSRSSSSDNQEAAKIAWAAPVPLAALQSTLKKLLAIVLDRKEDPETRHRAAAKLGLAAGAEEIRLLLDKREKAIKDKDERTRLYIETAVFASHDERAIPLLEEYVRASPSATARAGALVQLRDMLPPERYEALLQERSRQDPDQENRSDLQRELAERLRAAQK